MEYIAVNHRGYFASSAHNDHNYVFDKIKETQYSVSMDHNYDSNVYDIQYEMPRVITEFDHTYASDNNLSLSKDILFDHTYCQYDKEYRTQSSINQDYDLTSQVIYQSDEYTISDDHSYAYNIVSKLQSCDNSKIPLYTSEKQITSNFVPSSLNSEEVTCNCNPQDAAKFFNIPESLVMDIESLNTMVHRGVENHFAQCNYILAKSNRYAQNSLGDGNCYFRCLSLHFFGIEDFHEKIRRIVVQFIIDNIDSFRNDIQLNLNSLTVDQYLLNMLQTDGSRSSWATDIELEATSTMLQIPVYILSEWAQSMKWQRFTPKFPLPIPFFSRSPYITILNTGAHYMLVRNVNFNCNCFSPPPALEINNNIDIPEVIICKDEKFSPIKKGKLILI